VSTRLSLPTLVTSKKCDKPLRIEFLDMEEPTITKDGKGRSIDHQADFPVY
jgi:hypothetical protein